MFQYRFPSKIFKVVAFDHFNLTNMSMSSFALFTNTNFGMIHAFSYQILIMSFPIGNNRIL